MAGVIVTTVSASEGLKNCGLQDFTVWQKIDSSFYLLFQDFCGSFFTVKMVSD